LPKLFDTLAALLMTAVVCVLAMRAVGQEQVIAEAGEQT
jgi:hypothetical protein